MELNSQIIALDVFSGITMHPRNLPSKIEVRSTPPDLK